MRADRDRLEDIVEMCGLLHLRDAVEADVPALQRHVARILERLE